MSRAPTHHRTIKVGEAEVPIHRCNSCGAEILWATTPKDKSMPLDVTPSDAGTWITKLRAESGKRARILCFFRKLDALLSPGEKRRTAHWSTCPNADKHRGNQ